MESLSFDSMAGVYDETRIFDKDCFNSALDFIVSRFPPHRYNHIFESGIGTGRIAIPFTKRGYHVTGVDISQKMLEVLQCSISKRPCALQISTQQADAAKLPFDDQSFDMGVEVYLFYWMKQWQQAANELLRVVRKDGPIIIMHTGGGTEVPFLNERYKHLCQENGASFPRIGAASTQEILDYFEGLGCSVERIENRWLWNSRIRLDTALHYLKLRAYSFTTATPDKIHSRVIEQMESELKEQDSLTAEVDISSQIKFSVIQIENNSTYSHNPSI